MSALQALLDDPNTAGSWQLVPARSSVRFKNKTFWGLVTVTGEFTDVRGAGQITANGAVSGGLDIRASSLKTGIRKRDEHLRSADFFDVEKHPEIRVEVTGREAQRRQHRRRARHPDRAGHHATAAVVGHRRPAGRRHGADSRRGRRSTARNWVSAATWSA